MQKEGDNYDMTVYERDCGPEDFCKNFVCKDNYYCKCYYCNTDKCNSSYESLNISNFMLLKGLTFFFIIIKSFVF